MHTNARFSNYSTHGIVAMMIPALLSTKTCEVYYTPAYVTLALAIGCKCGFTFVDITLSTADYITACDKTVHESCTINSCHACHEESCTALMVTAFHRAHANGYHVIALYSEAHYYI